MERKHDTRLVALQPRDRRLLTELYASKVLTGSHLARLFFGSQSRADRRLRQLYDAGYLERLLLPSQTVGAPQVIYCVGKEGVKVLSEELGLDAKAIRRRRQMSSLFLEHQLSLNTVRLAFQHSLTPSATGWQFDCFIGEPDCHEVYAFTDHGKQHKRVFAPDGYVRLRHTIATANESTYRGYFIELDRATMVLSRVQAKVRGYLEYREFGLYPRRYGLPDFEVLVVTSSPLRRDSLLRSTASIALQGFWFTALGELESHGFRAPVWYQPGDKTARSLFSKNSIFEKTTLMQSLYQGSEQRP